MLTITPNHYLLWAVKSISYVYFLHKLTCSTLHISLIRKT